MEIRRRHFLGSVAGTTGALVAGNASAATPRAEDLDPVAIVPLGKDLKVSRIGLGTGMRGGQRQSNHTRMGYEAFERLALTAYDEGMRLFDVADMYGTHTFIAKALKGKPRDSYHLVTKIWWRKGGIPEQERPDADVVIKRFLKELDTDYLDLVQLHCTVSQEWTETLKDQMAIMAKLKEQGMIRAHGTSCHSVGALQAAAKDPWVDIVHTRFNHDGAKMDKPREDVAPALKKLREAGKGLIAMKTVGEGLYRGDSEKIDTSLRYVFGSGLIDVAIVGAEKPEEVIDYKARVAKALKAIA
jgi:aryl-alcohol dehydrogenase-like predicted oxidoreductase